MSRLNDTTELLTLRMTPTERAVGRFMRAPDHTADAGDPVPDGGVGVPMDGDKQEVPGDTNQSSDPSGDLAAAGDEPQTLLGKAKPDTSAGKDGEGDDGDKAGADKADADGPPETYELKLTTKDDDGKDVAVELDKELVEAATPVLKDIGLTNEQANKILPLVPQIQARALQDQADQFEALSAGWAKEVMADKEIGGKNFDKTSHLMGKAVDRFGSPEFTKLMEETRLGNHPAFVRVFRSIGERLSEDEDLPRGDAKAQPKSREETLYPDDVPKNKERNS